MTLSAVPLALKLVEPIPHNRGEITIWPDFEDGGYWRVDHVSASGDSAAIIATAFSCEEAVTIARAEAKRIGAIFDEGDSPVGGSAA